MTGAPKNVDVKVRTETCGGAIAECGNSQLACDTVTGNSAGQPTIVFVSVDGGAWQDAGGGCGVPDQVQLPPQPGADPGDPPQVVQIQAPPVPTFAQIQRAFRELPFSKPTIAAEPRDMRTLIDFDTYYAAAWPDDAGLQPGEISKPIKLLSWTIEYRIAAKDYRYSYGDGSTSPWTSSLGGGYPGGDIVHQYNEPGSVNVKVDARLTGQYRVNGGPWLDIATVADLQDEPVETLDIYATRTTLRAAAASDS